MWSRSPLCNCRRNLHPKMSCRNWRHIFCRTYNRSYTLSRSHTTRHTRSGCKRRCDQECSGNVREERSGRGAGKADQMSQLEPEPSFRRSRGPSTPDSFGERSESCDGSPQPLAVESIAKTSARLELIIVHLLFVLSCSMHSAAESVQEAGAGGRTAGG